MAIRLPPPPQELSDITQVKLWLQNLYEYVVGFVQTTGDAAASIGIASTYHGVTALTAPRTLTLPDANSLKDGEEIVIQDESGAAGTHTITIRAAGSDTLRGSTTMTSNYGRRRIIKRGSGLWYSV